MPYGLEYDFGNDLQVLGAAVVYSDAGYSDRHIQSED